MKIVIVRREPRAALSMDVYADNLVAELKKLRPTWQINEIAPRPWSDSKDNLWRSGTGLRKYYERFWCHPQQVSQLNADLFHIIDHSNAHVAYWLKRMAKPIVVTCHDLVQFIYPEILKEQSRLPALSMATWQFSVRGMLQADAIVSVSSNTASDITKMLHIPPEQITVAFNGVDPQFRALPETEVTALRQHYALSPQTCLLNVGSNHQRKNILTVLEVLMVLKHRGLSVSLWKTGDNFTIEQQAFIRKHGLEPNILYLGKPSKETLMQIYNAADVLLAPSLYEGFGLTILEAMACGRPVVTSNVSSLPEVAGDAAILVNPTDVVAIADAVCQLQNDPSYRQQLINRGIARASQFTWQNTAQQVAQVYEAVLGRR